jgi:endonuclease YncB( thermonuclease family)
MKLKLIMIFLMLSPLTTSAGEANTETSKLPASQVSSKQVSENGEISTIVGRIVFVKRRPTTKLKVSTSHEKELVTLRLHGVDSGIHKKCHKTYYLETIYSRYSQPRESQVKFEELQKLSSTWVELSAIKIINQGERYAACSFGRLKSISEPK